MCLAYFLFVYGIMRRIVVISLAYFQSVYDNLCSIVIMCLAYFLFVYDIMHSIVVISLAYFQSSMTICAALF